MILFGNDAVSTIRLSSNQRLYRRTLRASSEFSYFSESRTGPGDAIQIRISWMNGMFRMVRRTWGGTDVGGEHLRAGMWPTQRRNRRRRYPGRQLRSTGRGYSGQTLTDAGTGDEMVGTVDLEASDISGFILLW